MNVRAARRWPARDAQRRWSRVREQRAARCAGARAAAAASRSGSNDERSTSARARAQDAPRPARPARGDSGTSCFISTFTRDVVLRRPVERLGERRARPGRRAPRADAGVRVVQDDDLAGSAACARRARWRGRPGRAPARRPRSCSRGGQPSPRPPRCPTTSGPGASQTLTRASSSAIERTSALRVLELVGRQRDRADDRVPAAAVTLADGRDVVPARHGRPRDCSRC